MGLDRLELRPVAQVLADNVEISNESRRGGFSRGRAMMCYPLTLDSSERIESVWLTAALRLLYKVKQELACLRYFLWR